MADGDELLQWPPPPYKGPESLSGSSWPPPPQDRLPPSIYPPPVATADAGQEAPPAARMPNDIQMAPPVLKPVEHDPFEQTLKPPPQSQLLIPVDYDPFSPNDIAALRIRASVMGKGAPAGVDMAARTKGFKNLDDALLGRNGQERFQTFPERWARAAASEFGRAAEGQFPDTVYVPVGSNVSDEDLGRRFQDMNAGAEGASNFAMMGGPLQMVARGPKSFGSGNVLSTSGAQPPSRASIPENIRPQSMSAAADYFSTRFEPINKALRTGEALPPKASETVSHLDDLVTRSTLDGGRYYRGVSESLDLKKGSIFKDDGFVSALKNRETALEYTGAGDTGTVLSIRVPKGAPGLSADALRARADRRFDIPETNSGEIILPRGSEFEVKSVTDLGDGLKLVTADLVPPKRGGGGGTTLGTAGAEDGKGRTSVGPVIPAPPFYSAVEQTIADSSLKSATPEQWLGTLKNAKGVKGEELDWLGLPEWLAEQKGPVTKQQVADYVAQHKVTLKEVHKFGDETDALRDAVTDKSLDIMDEWTANKDRLSRGEGIVIERPTGRAGNGEQWVVKADGHIIGRLNSKEAAAKYVEEFKAELAKPEPDTFEFAQEVMHPANYPELLARHDSEGRVLPGGENYRELLLTLPPGHGGPKIEAVKQENGTWALMANGERFGSMAPGNLTQEAANLQARSAYPNSKAEGKFGPLPEDFRVSGHWEEPNVLAWARANDRTIEGEGFAVRNRTSGNTSEIFPTREAAQAYYDKLPEGMKAGVDVVDGLKAPKKALFMEEVQSDWHQRGREHGYKTADGDKVADKITADRDRWLTENGLIDERGRILTGQMTPEQKLQHGAWQAAMEAKNPEVYDLSLKAHESRMTRSKAIEYEYSKAANDVLGEDRLKEISSSNAIDSSPEQLVLSSRDVRDLREGGYITPAEEGAILAEAEQHGRSTEHIAISEKAEADQRALEAAQRQNVSGVPDAPLKKTWHEMVLKRMIREAAEHGYDKLAWTTGAQQNKRWNLASHVQEIEYTKHDDGSFALSATSRRGHDVQLPKAVWKPEELDGLVGKEIADKIRAGAGETYGAGSIRSLKGLDLEVGGEGMRGFYDKMMVDAANKIGKPHGAKVTEGNIELSLVHKGIFRVSNTGRTPWRIDGPNGTTIGPKFETEAAARDWLRKNGTIPEVVHTLDITPTLRDAAIGKGFPLFMGGVPVSRVQHDPFAEDDSKRKASSQ